MRLVTVFGEDPKRVCFACEGTGVSRLSYLVGNFCIHCGTGRAKLAEARSFPRAKNREEAERLAKKLIDYGYFQVSRSTGTLLSVPKFDRKVDYFMWVDHRVEELSGQMRLERLFASYQSLMLTFIRSDDLDSIRFSIRMSSVFPVKAEVCQLTYDAWRRSYRSVGKYPPTSMNG